MVDLSAEGSHLVTGGPGTGKTLIALYRAARLYDDGYNPKLIMYGRLLSQWTRRAARQLEISDSVATFHSWIEKWHRDVFSAPPPKLDEYTPDFDAILQAVLGRKDLRGSHEPLMIDEGQDFDRRVHLIAGWIAESVTVFADENQRITEHQSTLGQIRGALSFDTVTRLTENHRNTVEISRFAAHFDVGLGDGPTTPLDRHGDVPRLVRHRGTSDTVRFLRELEAEDPTDSIGVLVPTTGAISSLLKALTGKTRQPVQHYQSGQRLKVDFRDPGMVLITHQSAKGLEFDTVVIAGLEDLHTDDELLEARMRMYVLATRARTRLFVAYTGEALPRPVQRLLDPALAAGDLILDSDG